MKKIKRFRFRIQGSPFAYADPSGDWVSYDEARREFDRLHEILVAYEELHQTMLKRSVEAGLATAEERMRLR